MPALLLTRTSRILSSGLLLVALLVPAYSGKDLERLSKAQIVKLKARAEAGDVRAQVDLGHAYESGNGIPQSAQLATKWFRSAAEKGDAEAQNSLGVMYRTGEGVERDKAEAARWYAKAAQQGFAPAIYNLATCYYNGDGVPFNDVQAYALFLLAAQRNSGASEAVRRSEDELKPFRIGQGKLLAAEMLATGTGVPADPNSAIEILRTLKEEVDPKAIVKMAIMVREGQGFPREPKVAYQLFERAAKSGSTAALVTLAEMNEIGEGVERNEPAAAPMYLEAVRKGNDQAAIRLAHMYIEGRGVASDRVTAYLLLKYAAVDSERAKTQLADLKTKMSDAEVKTAEQRWPLWRP